MYVTVKMPGSCGELVQGQIDGVNFHITCPVNIFSQVTAYFSTSTRKITCSPKKKKALRATEKILAYLNGKGTSIGLRFFSRIPVGKGMASSTADIAGSCFAVANLLGKNLTFSKIASIASEIEPTDGIIHKGIVCFDHIRGKLIENLGYPPPMKVLVIDPGGKIDTLVFNKRKDLRILHRVNRKIIEEAYFLVKEGMKKKDPELIGAGATISSICNQIILYKPELTRIISLSKKLGALGVNVAHSGSVIGILLPSDFSRFNQLEQRIKKECGSHLKFYRTAITGGGPRIEDE